MVNKKFAVQNKKNSFLKTSYIFFILPQGSYTQNRQINEKNATQKQMSIIVKSTF